MLIVNLGTPESPKPRHVRSFLRTFLSDRRVIEMPPFIWKPILEGIILRVRPKHSGALYEQIWAEKAGEGVIGSPLLYWSEGQRKDLERRLSGEADIYIAMRYSRPTIADTLSLIQQKGYEHVLVVPMYPQYSASSAGSIIDEVSRWQLQARNQLEIHTMRSFPTDPLYIEALAQALETSWQKRGTPDFSHGQKLLLSYHSIPESMHTAGDPYVDECEATSRALARRLSLSNELGHGIISTYQSVFGPAAWVGPATIDTVRSLGRESCSRIDVMCPGFVADCLESLQEINILNREEFIRSGGSHKSFTYIPWANTAPAWMDALEHQIRIRLPRLS